MGLPNVGGRSDYACARFLLQLIQQFFRFLGRFGVGVLLDQLPEPLLGLVLLAAVDQHADEFELAGGILLGVAAGGWFRLRRVFLLRFWCVLLFRGLLRYGLVLILALIRLFLFGFGGHFCALVVAPGISCHNKQAAIGLVAFLGDDDVAQILAEHAVENFFHGLTLRGKSYFLIHGDAGVELNLNLAFGGIVEGRGDFAQGIAQILVLPFNVRHFHLEPLFAGLGGFFAVFLGAANRQDAGKQQRGSP